MVLNHIDIHFDMRSFVDHTNNLVSRAHNLANYVVQNVVNHNLEWIDHMMDGYTRALIPIKVKINK